MLFIFREILTISSLLPPPLPPLFLIFLLLSFFVWWNSHNIKLIILKGTIQRHPWWLRWYSVCLQCGKLGFNPWVGKISWRRKWHPTPVFLPGKSHGQRSLVGYSPWGCKELDTTERLHFHLFPFYLGIMCWSYSFPFCEAVHVAKLN